MLDVSTKECGVCKVVKPTSEFYFERRRDCPMWACKPCQKQLATTHQRNNPDLRRIVYETYKDKFPEKVKATDRKMHRRKQYRAFNVTQDELESAMIAQNGLCAICKSAKVHLDGGRHVHLDHCHKTKTFRGILCLQCNVILGMAGDDPERLLRAVDYLKLHSANVGKLT